MNFDLSDEQRDIQRLVRDFADAEVRPVAEELDREKRFPYEIVEKLGGLGLMGMPYPQNYGGGGSDNLPYAIAIEDEELLPDNLDSIAKVAQFIDRKRHAPPTVTAHAS